MVKIFLITTLHHCTPTCSVCTMSRKAAWWLLSPRKHCAQQAEVSRLLKVDTWPPPELELLPSCVALSLAHITSYYCCMI